MGNNIYKLFKMDCYTQQILAISLRNFIFITLFACFVLNSAIYHPLLF
jgi:hypothetical protein